MSTLPPEIFLNALRLICISLIDNSSIHRYSQAMTTPTKKLHPDSAIIDELGGPSHLARICKIKHPPVCRWRYTGIPPARRQYLELLRPDVFKPKKESK